MARTLTAGENPEILRPGGDNKSAFTDITIDNELAKESGRCSTFSKKGIKGPAIDLNLSARYKIQGFNNREPDISGFFHATVTILIVENLCLRRCQYLCAIKLCLHASIRLSYGIIKGVSSSRKTATNILIPKRKTYYT